MKLLIVDDEVIIREGIRRLIDFKKLGIEEIYEAENGEEALKLFKEYLPDIVLADINMPKMNGLELSKEMKGIKGDVHIALITGYDYFDYARQAIKIGVEDYILKPVSKNDITALLKEMIGRIKEETQLGVLRDIIENQNVHSNLQYEKNEVEDRNNYKTQIEAYFKKFIYDEALSLGGMADSLGLSESYLSTMFKDIFGIPFKRYVYEQRMNQSKILLLSTDMKNYEIAEAIGIKDPNYFSGIFKKYTGMSPNKYRETNGA